MTVVRYLKNLWQGKQLAGDARQHEQISQSHDRVDDDIHECLRTAAAANEAAIQENLRVRALLQSVLDQTRRTYEEADGSLHR